MKGKNLSLQIRELITKIVNDYSFLDLSEEDIDDIINNIIEKISSEYKNSGKSLDRLFSEIFISYFDEKVESLLRSDDCEKIIQCFIKDKLVVSKRYSDVIKQLIKLEKFFEKYECKYDLSMLVSLISKDIKLSVLLDVIFKEKYNYIVSDNCLEFTDSDLIINLMNAYCLVNKIEIKRMENQDSDKFEDVNYYDDSFKMFFEELKNYPRLTIEEERMAFEKLALGSNSARDRIFTGNLRLVAYVAKKYIGCGIEFLDLVQEGGIGLLNAIDKFDLSKNCKFSTFATPAIERSIINAIYKYGREIKLPIRLAKKVNEFNKVQKELTVVLGRIPKIEEIANKMRISDIEAKELYDYSRQANLISLNDLICADDDTVVEFGETIASEFDLETCALASVRRIEALQLVDSIITDKIDKEVILRIFGFYGKEESLESIGKDLGISKLKVKDIESRTIRTMRNRLVRFR